MWQHGSSFCFACPQGLLCERSRRKRPTDQRCVAKPVGRRQGLTTGEGRCGRLLEISSKSLCISFWCPSATVAGGELAIKDDLGQAMVLHPGDVPCPTQRSYSRKDQRTPGHQFNGKRGFKRQEK